MVVDILASEILINLRHPRQQATGRIKRIPHSHQCCCTLHRQDLSVRQVTCTNAPPVMISNHLVERIHRLISGSLVTCLLRSPVLVYDPVCCVFKLLSEVRHSLQQKPLFLSSTLWKLLEFQLAGASILPHQALHVLQANAQCLRVLLSCNSPGDLHLRVDCRVRTSQVFVLHYLCSLQPGSVLRIRRNTLRPLIRLQSHRSVLQELRRCIAAREDQVTFVI